MDKRLTFFIDRVQSQYFNDFPIYRTAQDEYAGVFMKHLLTSRFRQPGHHQMLAEPECRTPTGEVIGIETLLRLCRASQTAVVLDRFIRSIHLLNFMCQPAQAEILFLPVSNALIRGVASNHGKAFRGILDRLELSQQQFGIVLPEKQAHDPWHDDDVHQAYRNNGFVTARYQPDGGIAILRN